MTWVKWVMVAFGVALIAMGVQSAFFPLEGSKPSMVSLAAAGGAGMVVLLSVGLSFVNPRAGYIMTLLICALLIARFGVKAIQGQTYPALLTIALAFITAGALLAGHFMAQRAKSSEGA